MKVLKLVGLLLLTTIIFSEEQQSPAFTYAGGWPGNPRIDDIEDPGFDLHCPGPTGLPCIFLVDENMRLINYTNRGLTDAFLYLTQSKK